MTVTDPLAGFSNLLDRPPGRVLRLLGVALPGVREVAAQREPYAAFWAAANAKALAADGPLWVALGDSMTQGIGASAPDRGWVGQARARFATPPRVVNLSMSGAQTTDVLERQLPVLERLATPALVTVLVGANDVVNPARRGALPDAFARLLDRLPHGAVVARMPQPVRAAERVNDLIDADVGAGRVVGVTVETDWRGKVAADRFHPNDDGYAVIAGAFVDAIRSAGHG